ncbi:MULTISPECIES: DUF4199 domain-containing protein [Chitinophagaceae]
MSLSIPYYFYDYYYWLLGYFIRKVSHIFTSAIFEFNVMKKIMLIFGLGSAGSMAALYVLMCLARNSGNIVPSSVLVYAAVVLLFVLLFLAIRSYRDHALGGFITFGKALKAGILMALVSSLCYAIMWTILFNPIFKHFMEQHAADTIAKLSASGASVQEIAANKAEIVKHIQLYEIPLLRAVLIFIQGFPVEVIMAVIAAFLLKKKRPDVA